MKKISVIIPVYGVEKYIKQCLETIVNQTYKNLEIIIVNDGTEDKSIEIIEKNFKDERIKIITKINGGISSARNRGLKEATGDYISFIDSDDYIELNLYERVIQEIDKEELLIFNYSRYYEKENCLKHKILNMKEIEKIPKELLFRNINGECWNKIYQTKFLRKEKIKFIEGIVYEDIVWGIETLHKAKNIKLINFDGYIYRCDRQGSIVNTTSLKTSKKTCEIIIKKIEQFLRSNKNKLSKIQKYRLKLYKIYMETFLKKEIQFSEIENELEKIKFFQRDKLNFKVLKGDIQEILKRKNIKNIKFFNLFFLVT